MIALSAPAGRRRVGGRARAGEGLVAPGLGHAGEPTAVGSPRGAARCPSCGRTRTGCTSRAARSGSGCPHPGREVPERVEPIRRTLAGAGAPVVAAAPHDDAALAGRARRAAASSSSAPPGTTGRPPATPTIRGRIASSRTSSRIPGWSAASSRSCRRRRAARAGDFCFDTMTLIGPGTWEAARGAADAALTACDLVLAGEPPRTRAVARRATTSREPLRRLAATSTTPRSRAQRLRDARRRARGDRRHRRPPRQRRAVDLLGARRRLHRLRPRRSRGGLVPALPRRRGASAGQAPATGANLNLPLAAGVGGRPTGCARSPSSRRPRAAVGCRGARARARGRRRRRRPGEPAARSRTDGLPRGRADRRPTTGCRPSSCRRVDTISPRSAGSCSPRSRVVEEGQGCLSRLTSGSEPRSTAACRRPTRAWTHRCRRTGGWRRSARRSARARRRSRPDGRSSSSSTTATHRTCGCSTSRAASSRAADDGPRPAAVLGGHDARALPGRPDRRLRRRGLGLARRRRRAAPPRSSSRPAARSGSVTTGSSSRSSGTSCGRLAVVDVADPWPQPLVRAAPGLERDGDEREAAVSPDGRTVAYSFRSRTISTAARSASSDVDDGRGARRSPVRRRSRDGRARLVARRATLAFTAQRGEWWELHAVDLATGADACSPPSRPTSPSPPGAATGRGSPRFAPRAGSTTSSWSTPSPGRSTSVAAGGCCGAPLWAADGSLVVTYEDHATPPRAAPRRGGGATAVSCSRRHPLRSTAAPHVAPGGGVVPLVRRLRDQRAALPAARGATRRAPGASSTPTAARPSARRRVGRASRSTSSTRATHGCSAQLPWLDGPREARSSGERRRLGRRRRCATASPRRDYLAALDWVDAARLAIFGPSYGSYLALCAVVEDARAALPLPRSASTATATSSRRGRRATGAGSVCGENMLGHPRAGNREVYLRGSPIHRLDRVAVPTARRPRRARRAGVAAAVRTARRPSCAGSGRRYEYVTYPTEAHGFLRAGPFLDFYQRLERFLDWYLL